MRIEENPLDAGWKSGMAEHLGQIVDEVTAAGDGNPHELCVEAFLEIDVLRLQGGPVRIVKPLPLQPRPGGLVEVVSFAGVGMAAAVTGPWP